ncbi:hypothetical protein V6N13_047884 [Hibiscus sabdariffa]
MKPPSQPKSLELPPQFTLHYERLPAYCSYSMSEFHQGQFFTPKVSTGKLSQVGGGDHFISMQEWWKGKLHGLVLSSITFHFLVIVETYHKFDMGIRVICFNLGDSQGACFRFVHCRVFVVVSDGSLKVFHVLNNAPSIVYLGYSNKQQGSNIVPSEAICLAGGYFSWGLVYL